MSGEKRPSVMGDLMRLALAQPVASYLRTMTMQAVECSGHEILNAPCRWQEDRNPSAFGTAPHCLTHGTWWTGSRASSSD